MRSSSLFACVVALGVSACQEPPDALTAADRLPEASAVAAKSLYEVVALPTLDGSNSQGRSLSRNGSVAGFSHAPDGATQQATVWRNGEPIGLRTLGGPSSSVVWPGQNEGGLVVGISETADLDPEGANFSCFFFFPAFPDHSGHICRGFAWQDGVMRELPTLGGHNGFATGVNNRGQIVGWAENMVRDPTCQAGSQVFQFRAVVWGPEEDEVRELPPMPGDSVSAATAINDRGQVVGISGDCDQAVGRHSARHAVLWERGKVIDLGNLGGSAWNTPMYISARGDVVGFAAAGEGGPLRGFVWTPQGGIEGIDPLEPCTGTHQAHAINARRQVVGIATGCPDNRSRAFLWEDGVIRDLNRMVVPGSGLFLLNATEIDDRGRITGAALDEATGDVVPFIATPSARSAAPRR